VFPSCIRYFLDYPLSSGLGGLHLFQFIQREDRKVRSGSRAKIFGGYVPARDCPQIFVHIARVDAVPAAFAICILKQFRTRQFAAAFQNAREFAFTDYAAMTDAALCAKIELDLSSLMRT
jgi:hypothetical protein